MNRVYLVAVLLLVASFPFAQTWAEQKRAGDGACHFPGSEGSRGAAAAGPQ